MEAILAIGGIWLFFFLVRIVFRSLGAATKATVDAASGKKNFAESFSDNFSGFGDFKFKVEKQTSTEGGKSFDSFVMQFKGLFPSNLNNRNLSFIFNIFDDTDEKDPSVVMCPVPGFNEGSTQTFQFIRPVGPIQENYGYSDWVTVGVAPIEFLKFPKKGKLKLKFQCCITLQGMEPQFKLGGVDDQQDIIRVYKQEIEFYNNETGYLEISEKRKILDKTIIQFGFYVSSVDGEIDKKEGLIIRDWCKEQINAAPPTKADETKLRLNENVKEAFEAANKHEISISDIVSNLKNNATKVEKYEALELALKVMQADGKADQKELDTLDKISLEIDIDPEEYKKLREQSVATVDIVAEKETSENVGTKERREELARVIGFNVNDDQSKIRRVLLDEGKKWRSRVNVSDEKIRNNANNMLKLIAEARKTFLND